MGVSDEARDPWGILIAGVAGGLSWAIGAPVLAAAGVGAAVYGVKVLTGGVFGRQRAALPATRGTRVRSGSPEAEWVARAERALQSFKALGTSAGHGPVAEKSMRMGEEVSTTLEGVRRLASQASALAIAGERVDEATLAQEAVRLRDAVANAPIGPRRVELERALGSVRAQLDVDRRLADAGSTVMARLEATVMGLEGLVARLVEVLALVETQSPDEAAGRIDALGTELEGLRSGLVETEDLSRRILSAYATEEAGDQGRRRRSREKGDSDVEAP